MSRNPIIPCLWFDDQAEPAAAFYTKTFPDGRITAVSHYPESFDNPGGKPRGSVLTVELEVAGQRFTALNGGPQFTINPSVSFFAHVTTAEGATRLSPRSPTAARCSCRSTRTPGASATAGCRIASECPGRSSRADPRREGRPSSRA